MQLGQLLALKVHMHNFAYHLIFSQTIKISAVCLNFQMHE